MPPKRRRGGDASQEAAKSAEATSGVSGWSESPFRGYRTEGESLEIPETISQPQLDHAGIPSHVYDLDSDAKTFTGSFRSPFEHNWACSRVQQAYCISFGRKHGEIKVCQG